MPTLGFIFCLFTYHIGCPSKSVHQIVGSRLLLQLLQSEFFACLFTEVPADDGYFQQSQQFTLLAIRFRMWHNSSIMWLLFFTQRMCRFLNLKIGTYLYVYFSNITMYLLAKIFGIYIDSYICLDIQKSYFWRRIGTIIEHFKHV